MSSLSLLIRSGLIWRALPPEERVDSINPSAINQQKTLLKEQFHPVPSRQCQDLHELCIEQHQFPYPTHSAPPKCLSFGIEQIDQQLPAPGLPAGTIHEWNLNNPLSRHNTTPHSLFAWMAFRAWQQSQTASSSPLRFIFWIGREAWPSPHTLAQISHGENKKGAFFGQNIFIDVTGEKERLWSIETALRSSAAALVIAPLTTPSLIVSRRLLLAAERGGSIGLFSIPQQMQQSTTASLSRWEVSPSPSPSDYPRWKLELKKWKGAYPEAKSWEVELSPPSIKERYFSGAARQTELTQAASLSGAVSHERTQRAADILRSIDAFSLHIPADVVARNMQKKISGSNEQFDQQEPARHSG